jgi:hypothetical protein
MTVHLLPHCLDSTLTFAPRRNSLEPQMQRHIPERLRESSAQARNASLVVPTPFGCRQEKPMTLIIVAVRSDR